MLHTRLHRLAEKNRCVMIGTMLLLYNAIFAMIIGRTIPGGRKEIGSSLVRLFPLQLIRLECGGMV